MRLSYCDLLLLILAATSCQCSLTFDKVGDSHYFIGKGNTDEQIFDWFDARRSCQAQGGQLVSVLTAKQMIELESYILGRGYPNGSLFSTSGHSFESEYPFKWSALGKSLTYTKWLPNEGPPLNSFLSLQLVNSELFMVTSWGFDEFYILFLLMTIKKKRALPEDEQLLKS